MSSRFANILRQARKTFEYKNLNDFRSEFLLLKQLIDKLTLSDMNINPYYVSKSAFQSEDAAPCAFIHIFENDNMAVSVFILDDNYTMPLHDHPMMHGILKNISGKIRIQSYSEIKDITPPNASKRVVVKQEPIIEISAESDCVILTPSIGNYHEITAVDGPAAFFDVLSPPYDAKHPTYGSRKCSFYTKIKDDNNLILETIPTPRSYFNDTPYYEPPDFLNEIFLT